MFRIPKSQLSRPRDPSTPPASAASIRAEGETAPSARQRPAGLRPPFPGSATAGGGPELTLQTRSSRPAASRPSTAACSRTTSSFRDDGDDDRSFNYRRRLRERHVTQEEGGGACVVVVAPGPVAAAAAAASKRQTRRLRPPTPVEGDGFPSVTDEQHPRAATRCFVPPVASPTTTYPTSGVGYSSSSLDTATTAGSSRGTRRSATEEEYEASHDGRSGGGSRVGDEPGSWRSYYRPKVGARVMLAVLVGSSLLLLALLLAYNTELEKTIIYKVKLVFDKSLRRHQVRGHVNFTNSTSIEAGGDDDDGPGASRGSTLGKTVTDLPENPEEFEKRLREMVSRFWTPRGEDEYAGDGGFAFDPQRTMATRRGWRYRKEDEEFGGPPPIPGVRGGDGNAGPEQPDGNEPTEPLSQPFVRGASNRGTNWFLVQARRRHGRLPDMFFSANDSTKHSGNASLEDAAEIEQFWQEGDDTDEDDARHRF